MELCVKPYGENNYIVTYSSTQIMQLHVSVLGIGHLQVVHNLSISYTICVGFTLEGGGNYV